MLGTQLFELTWAASQACLKPRHSDVGVQWAIYLLGSMSIPDILSSEGQMCLPVGEKCVFHIKNKYRCDRGYRKIQSRSSDLDIYFLTVLVIWIYIFITILGSPYPNWGLLSLASHYHAKVSCRSMLESVSITKNNWIRIPGDLQVRIFENSTGDGNVLPWLETTYLIKHPYSHLRLYLPVIASFGLSNSLCFLSEFFFSKIEYIKHLIN